MAVSCYGKGVLGSSVRGEGEIKRPRGNGQILLGFRVVFAQIGMLLTPGPKVYCRHPTIAPNFFVAEVETESSITVRCFCKSSKQRTC